jgi:hypothetical protein
MHQKEHACIGHGNREREIPQGMKGNTLVYHNANCSRNPLNLLSPLLLLLLLLVRFPSVISRCFVALSYLFLVLTCLFTILGSSLEGTLSNSPLG